MNTLKFIQTLVSNNGKELKFILPNGTNISGDLHITEIQHHSVESVDCGGNGHNYNETVVQLMVNELSLASAKWTTDKAMKIINIVGQRKNYSEDAEIYIEFGNSNHPTIKYSIQNIENNPLEVSVKLAVKPTVCKPSLKTIKKAVACC